MAHEDITREERVEGSSNRSFGIVFACVFLIVAGWPLLHGEQIRWWATGLAIVFLLLALVVPAVLTPLNTQWTRLGVLLGKIVSPIALGILFFLVITPIGAIMRFTDKDPLRMRRRPDARSYWITREPPGPPPDSMTNQF